MYASFDFTFTTTTDIPELHLIDQEVALTIEMDGELEEFHIDDVVIRSHHMVRHPNPDAGRPVWESKTTDIPIDRAIVEAIVCRFISDPAFDDAVGEFAHDYLGNQF